MDSRTIGIGPDAPHPSKFVCITECHAYIVTCLAFNVSEPHCHGLEVSIVSLSYPPPGVTSFLLIFSLLIATWRSVHCCTAEEFAPSSSTFSLPSRWLAFVDSLLMFSVLLLLSFSFSTSRVHLKVIGVYGMAWSNFGVLQLVVPCGTCPCQPSSIFLSVCCLAA